MAATVKVWDPLIRLFHWGLVLSFGIAWLSGDTWDDLHEWAGYAAAALIGVRLVWGLFGSRYARFAQFVTGPRTVAAYLVDVARRQERRHVGHNPAGGAMILALILAMAGLSLTGWMYTTDMFWGVDWVETTHELLADGLLVLIGVHVAGVVVASLRHHENLARAMVTGRKRRPAGTDID